MLPKSKRLTTEDFKKIRGGKTIHTPHLIVRLTQVPPGLERFAVIVSSSSYKRAVDRNLLRRRVYGALENLSPLPQGCVMTVTCKRGALTATFAGLQSELKEGITKKA
ncbi:MAG: ribonuclease P protein component [bacterium]|nr:ribonuclease P protein component [bacterium]